MKLFKNLLALLVALTCVFAVVACDDGETSEELDTTKHGWAYEYEIEEASDENDNKSYVVITGLFLADGEKYAVSEGTYESIEINVATEIKVPVYDSKTKKEVYENDNLKTETLALGEDYAGFKVADAAFAGQLIINKVTLGEKVVEVGSGAFAGCANIEEMTIPFVGASANAEENKNAKKVFGYIFGTAEASNCTSVTCKYNESGSATYYVPNSLKKVTVNAQGTELGAYAFNGLSTVQTIVLNGALTSIGNYAFEGCSAAYNVTIPATVETLGKGAFKSCSNLINFVFPTSLTTIYQEAFYGCSRLGYGKNTVVELANVTHVYDKAFYNCTSISSVKLANVSVIGEYAFYGCAALENVEYNTAATVANGAFGKTPYAKNNG